MKLKIENYKLKIPAKRAGMTLFIAVVVMNVLLFITFAVVNIALKGTLFASSGRDSQKAFYAADSGVECALYWDSKDPSAFDTGSSASWAEVHITEFSGIENLTNPLDKTSMRTAITSSNPVLMNSGSQTTSFNNEMIFGYTDQWLYSSGTVNPGAGFTRIAWDFSDAIEFKNVTSKGNYAATFSMANPNPRVTGSWGALMATFRIASGETPAVVQHKADDGLLAQNISFDDPSVDGDLIVVSFQYDTFDFVIASITDTKGNNYQRAVGPLTYLDGTSPRSQEVWYAYDITGTVGTERITITANSPAFVPTDVNCGGQIVTAGLGTTNDVSTNPAQPHRIGGDAAVNNPTDPNTSIFQLNFTDSTCAIVEVTKNPGSTHIQSRGYNTCNTSYLRRVERGVEVTY